MTFDFGTNSKAEPYINISLGIFCLLCVLISTILNPLIFYVYTKKSSSIMNFLFKVIAASDFMTNFLPAIFISYIFLSQIQFNQHSFWNLIPDFFCCTLGCISQVTVTLMALTRMIKIIRPFFSMDMKWVLAYLTFYAVYMAIGNAGSLIIAGVRDFNPGSHPEESMSRLSVANKYLCFAMNMFHCLLGLFCSLLTVIFLRLNKVGNNEQAMKIRSSNTILLMNVPYTISIIVHFLALDPDIGIDLSLVKHYIIPIMTSAFNPCVIVLRTNTLQSVQYNGRFSKWSSDRQRSQISYVNKRSLGGESYVNEAAIGAAGFQDTGQKIGVETNL